MSYPTSWDLTTGKLCPVGGFDLFYIPTGSVGFSPGESFYVTVDRAGAGNFAIRMGYNADDLDGDAYLRIDSGTVEVRSRKDVAYQSTTYTTGLDANHPNRVQVEIQRLGVPDHWTGIKARARSAHGAAWSEWATSMGTNEKPLSVWFMNVTPLATISALQVTTEADPALWAVPTADLQPLGGIITAPYLRGDADAWSGIQEVAAACLGAAWVSRDKVFKLRNKEYLAGVGEPPVEDLDIGMSATDVGWSIDPADTADRLVLSYIPIDFEDVHGGSATAIEVWRAPDVFEIPANTTITVAADVPFWAVIDGFGWAPAWTPDLQYYTGVWSAYTDRDPLAGTRSGTRALTVTNVNPSSGRTLITITNNTDNKLYTVDANGEPCIILYASRIARQRNAAILTRGLSEDDAINPVTVDLGNHVQRKSDAKDLADYIWARVSSPSWKASSVRVAVDWRRDIGDIVNLTHERSDLIVRALVTKVAYEGTAGEVAQTLDLVLLERTWQDFDDALAGSTWAEFDTLWAGRTWADFDHYPLEVP